MNPAGEFVKLGGFLGFSTVFLFVLLNEQDIVSAVFDASVACVIMGLVFKVLYSYAVGLHREIMREKRHSQQEEELESTSGVDKLTDRGIS
jgi:uncharacterized membrane protein YjfL (UPF0719 family)